MFSVELSNGTRITASLALARVPPSLAIEQGPKGGGDVTGRIMIPLTDLKKTAEAVTTIVKAFRG